jgi:hypothetical protein
MDLLSQSLTPEQEEQRITQTRQAIEAKRQQEAELVEQSTVFFGTSDYILEQIGQARVLGRWITPEDLIEGVREQVREIIHSIFLWTRGDYSFQMGPLPTDELITMRVNTTDLIRTGIQRITTWSRIREAIGGLETRYRTLPEFDVARSGITLCREEERLLQFLAQPGSVGEVCDTLNGNDFETCRTIWAFSIMGALERVRQA